MVGIKVISAKNSEVQLEIACGNPVFNQDITTRKCSMLFVNQEIENYDRTEKVVDKAKNDESFVVIEVSMFS